MALRPAIDFATISPSRHRSGSTRSSFLSTEVRRFHPGSRPAEPGSWPALWGRPGIVLDQIWAPWRAQYIHAGASATGAPDGCFICWALASDADRANLLVDRGEHSVVMLNRYPYNNGHLLVAPRLHRGTLGELEGPDLVEPIAVVRRMTAVLDRMLRPQGYNVGLNQGKAAGAGLPGHLHWHIVPRWDGDTNFMPILGQTKVIVESLSEFYDRLIEELAGDAGSGT
jgi:ATP adenylyltransferase